MPTETMIILSAIVSGFLLFGGVLAWGAYQTSHLIRKPRRHSVETTKAPTSIRIIGGTSDVSSVDEDKSPAELAHMSTVR